MSGATLAERATAALERIARCPAALTPTPDRYARWLAALAKLHAAAADFAALAAEGDDEALLEAGEIGDSLLVDRARDAAGAVMGAREVVGGVEYRDLKEEWAGYGEDLASGESRGEEGQRLLIAIAEKLRARYGH